MIQHSILLFIVLVVFVAGVYWAKTQRVFQSAFRFLPVPFWCYFLPMLASTFGLFPDSSPLYGFLSRFVLPLCLAMLLIHVDLLSVAQAGQKALLMMGVALLGIVCGAVVSFSALQAFLPPESWKAVGALSGSWMGGSANMLAIKEALSTPDSVFAPMIVVDTFLVYGWMALLIFLAGYQDKFDAWNGARTEGIKGLDVTFSEGNAQSGALSSVIGLLGVSLGLALGSIYIGDRLPAVGAVLSHKTWTVLIVSTSALVFSFWFNRSQLVNPKASVFLEKTGMFVLYVLLASMGARAKLTVILDAPVFLLFGLLCLLVHGVILFVGARLLRAPLFLMAAASQSCLGGPISGPLVAAVYRPALAGVGLLLAIIGNVFGTYLGLIVARICQWMG